MKKKQIFLLSMWSLLLLCCTQDVPQYFNLTFENTQFAEVSYSKSERKQFSPVEYKKANKKKRKRKAKKQFKTKIENSTNKTQIEWVSLGGALLLTFGGLILSALFAYLGTLFIPWFIGLNVGCSSTFAAVALVSLAWIGWIYLGIIAIVLLVCGIAILSTH